MPKSLYSRTKPGALTLIDDRLLKLCQQIETSAAFTKLDNPYLTVGVIDDAMIAREGQDAPYLENLREISDRASRNLSLESHVETASRVQETMDQRRSEDSGYTRVVRYSEEKNGRFFDQTTDIRTFEALLDKFNTLLERVKSDISCGQAKNPDSLSLYERRVVTGRGLTERNNLGAKIIEVAGDARADALDQAERDLAPLIELRPLFAELQGLLDVRKLVQGMSKRSVAGFWLGIAEKGGADSVNGHELKEIAQGSVVLKDFSRTAAVQMMMQNALEQMMTVSSSSIVPTQLNIGNGDKAAEFARKIRANTRFVPVVTG